MPTNYFVDRQEETRWPSKLNIGDTVYIIQKEDQGTKDVKKLVLGQIITIYSKGKRYENGAKVKIILDEKDHRYKELGDKEFVGRVQYIAKKFRKTY